MKPVLVLTPSQVIDEIGELRRKVAEAAVRITKEVGVDRARLTELEDLAQSWYVDHPAEQPGVVEGQRYFLGVSAREWHREFSIDAKRSIFQALQIKLGADPLGLFGITLETVKTHLGGPALEELATKERTGQRRLDLVAKAPPAVPVKAKAPALKAA